MQTKFTFIIVLLFSFQANAQFLKQLADKAVDASARTLERKVEEKSEKTTGDAVDKTLNKKKKSKSDSESEEVSDGSKSKKDKKGKADKTPAAVKTAKDFIPGDKILAKDDFMQDAIGDFPVNWTTNSSGEVVTISGTTQRWLKLTDKGAYSILDVKSLPANFTFEFDVFTNEGFSFYSTFLGIGFVESKKKNDYMKWEEYGNGQNGVIVRMAPTTAYEEKNAGRSQIKVFENGEETLKNEIEIKSFNHTDKNMAKVQIWRQKNRLRMYVNGEKAWDLPTAFGDDNYNSIVFYIDNYQNPEDKYYIANLRLAQAGGDTRHKLIETGSFTTNEILFDTGKATIKSSSAAVLNDLGKALKDNPNVKVSITGHTDADGNDAANKKLSEQRAESVKNYLATHFSLEKTRMAAEGKGETEPLAPNTTEEGKKQNRRVAFKIIK